MTITHFDRFAVLPKRCECCNRLFIFEMYNIDCGVFYNFFKKFDIEIEAKKRVKCMKCIQKDSKKLDDSEENNGH